MAKESEIAAASAVDIAADLESHRRMYRNFLRLLTYAAVAVSVVLVIVFFILN